jgi:hypothetical protein
MQKGHHEFSAFALRRPWTIVAIIDRAQMEPFLTYYKYDFLYVTSASGFKSASNVRCRTEQWTNIP